MYFKNNKEKGNTGLAMAIAYYGANGYIVSIPLNDTHLHICEGANITLKDFFDSKLFDEVEAVEKIRKEYKKK